MNDELRKQIARLREYEGRAIDECDIALVAQMLADDTEFVMLCDEIAKSLGCTLTLLARMLIAVDEVRKRRMS